VIHPLPYYFIMQRCGLWCKCPPSRRHLSFWPTVSLRKTYLCRASKSLSCVLFRAYGKRYLHRAYSNKAHGKKNAGQRKSLSCTSKKRTVRLQKTHIKEGHVREMTCEGRQLMIYHESLTCPGLCRAFLGGARQSFKKIVITYLLFICPLRIHYLLLYISIMYSSRSFCYFWRISFVKKIFSL
jgi:hypothetical protein